MQIVARLKVLIDGKYEDAVLIKDDSGEYPVFYESLINPVYFPGLIDNGYSLAKLPFGFVKDGVAISDLPEKIITPTPDEVELMYNRLGKRLPDEELKKYLSVEATYYQLPKTEYTIFTREEFLSYLKVCKAVDNDNDFKPINYFVAPEARFSIEEFLDAQNATYVQTITERRAMSVHKLDKLINWLQQINLRPNPNEFDVMEAYMAWGLDGLNLTLLDYKRTSDMYTLRPNREAKVLAYDHCLGAIDGMGNKLIPEERKGLVWEVDPAENVEAIVAQLPPNGIAPLEMRCRTTASCGTLYCKEGFNIQFSSTLIRLSNGYNYPAITVKSMAESACSHGIAPALPAKRSSYMVDVTLRALASKLFKMRRSRVHVSSYKALTVRGLSPDAAVLYTLASAGIPITADVNRGDEEVSTISPTEVDKFLHNNLEGNVADMIQDVIDGVINCDTIADAYFKEGIINTESTYKILYCVHHFLGVSLEDILKKIQSITKETQSIHFEGNGLAVDMDTAPIRYRYHGYQQDIVNYEYSAAETCSNFVWVTKVARAVGQEGYNKHVGFEGYRVFRSKEVNAIIKQLKEDYTARVNRMVSNNETRSKLLLRAEMFALYAFFEIAFKHEITYPKALGGDKVPAMPSMITACESNLIPVVESTLAYTKNSFTGENSTNLVFTNYCCNAYITAEYVIPKDGVTIKEYPFYTLWYYWQRYDPNVYAQLLQKGILSPDFVAWSARYLEQNWLASRVDDELDEYDNLQNYYNAITEYVKEMPADVEFITPTPVQLEYPSLWHEDELEYLDTPRTSTPVVRLGQVRDITLEDYKDLVLPQNDEEEPDQYIKEFVTYDAEGLIYCDDILSKVPALGKKPFYVSKRYGSLVLPETQEIMDFRRLLELSSDEYAYVQLYGRIYLLRDCNNKLWEVRI